MSKRLEKKIFRNIRDANLKYRLLENGDRVAIGMSGGKDSLTLLYFLLLLYRYTPLDFSVFPVYLDLGWENDIEVMLAFCEELGTPLTIEKTNIGRIVFDNRQEKNPCSLCANLRRGALNRVGKGLNCNKVALGHHLDDVVNTMFLSMLFEGRFKVFKPSTYLDRMDITIIRPLVYVEEADIIRFIEAKGLALAPNRCPADGVGKRAEVEELLNLIESHFPGARKKFLASIENIDRESFWT